LYFVDRIHAAFDRIKVCGCHHACAEKVVGTSSSPVLGRGEPCHVFLSVQLLVEQRFCQAGQPWSGRLGCVQTCIHMLSPFGQGLSMGDARGFGAFWWMFVDLGRRVALWVGLWGGLVDFGKLWRTLEHFGKLWKTLENFGKLWIWCCVSLIWLDFVRSGELWGSLEHFWRTLENFGKLWKTLEHFGKLWKTLEHFGFVVALH
jgi:hypothetical protein